MRFLFVFVALLVVGVMAFSVIAASNVTVNTTNSTTNETAPSIKPVAKSDPVKQVTLPLSPPVAVSSGPDPVFIIVNVAAGLCLLFIVSRYLARDVV